MGSLIDLTGRRFGRLVVIKRAQDYIYRSGRREPAWKCICDCGKEIDVLGNSLRTGSTNSCGCLWRERTIEASKTHGACVNGKSARLYTIWCNMKSRCGNEKHHEYYNYGGRGINVCPELENDFSSFAKWAKSHGYKEELSIDRIDINGDYCPENCRWATKKEQANNRRNNRIITVNGVSKTMSEWSDVSGVSSSTIWARMNRYGWDAAKAVLTPTGTGATNVR